MQQIERYLLATHCCSERCWQRGRGLREHNAFALAVLNARDIEAQRYIEAAAKRGDIKPLEQIIQQSAAPTPQSPITGRRSQKRQIKSEGNKP